MVGVEVGSTVAGYAVGVSEDIAVGVDAGSTAGVAVDSEVGDAVGSGEDTTAFI